MCARSHKVLKLSWFELKAVSFDIIQLNDIKYIQETSEHACSSKHKYTNNMLLYNQENCFLIAKQRKQKREKQQINFPFTHWFIPLYACNTQGWSLSTMNQTLNSGFWSGFMGHNCLSHHCYLSFTEARLRMEPGSDSKNSDMGCRWLMATTVEPLLTSFPL